MSSAETHLQVNLAEVDDLTVRLAAARYLGAQLAAARLGVLDIDWRTTLIESTAEPLDGIADHQHQLLRRAADQVANLPNQDWEPDMQVGWRDSLEAWFAATKQCIDTTCDVQVRFRRAAAQSTRDVHAAAAMDHDLTTASYRAGLSAAGLVSDWHRWLTDRVHSWPPGPRRDRQIDTLQDPAFKLQLQQLPRYWV